MREFDELRPLTAGRLLGLWQECREMGDLTGRQMERLLLHLAEDGGPEGRRPGGDGDGAEDPAFDMARFEALRGEGRTWTT